MALSLTAGVMGEGWEGSMSTPRTDHLPPQVLKYLCSLSRPQFLTPPVLWLARVVGEIMSTPYG